MPARILLTLCLLANSAELRAQEYDPLQIDKSITIQVKDFTIEDSSRDREIPVRVYYSDRTSPAPVVLFSHGLGGSRENNSYLGKHWSAHGYVVIFLQHPGSDESVWRDAPLLKKISTLAEAASAQNLFLRLVDVHVTLDQLDNWNTDPEQVLYKMLDLSRVGMSGHSFGAQTTQGVSGQAIPLIGQKYTDDRIKAALAFSPGAPRGSRDLENAFGHVKIPWMLMTGTRDTSPIGGQTVESRQKVFPALPPGDKFEVVLHEAEHSAFNERSLPGDRHKPNPNHHKVILALSTAFWDTYLKKDPVAKAWLQGTGPTKIMEPEDRWQTK